MPARRPREKNDIQRVIQHRLERHRRRIDTEEVIEPHQLRQFVARSLRLLITLGRSVPAIQRLQTRSHRPMLLTRPRSQKLVTQSRRQRDPRLIAMPAKKHMPIKNKRPARGKRRQQSLRPRRTQNLLINIMTSPQDRDKRLLRRRPNSTGIKSPLNRIGHSLRLLESRRTLAHKPDPHRARGISQINHIQRVRTANLRGDNLPHIPVRLHPLPFRIKDNHRIMRTRSPPPTRRRSLLEKQIARNRLQQHRLPAARRPHDSQTPGNVRIRKIDTPILVTPHKRADHATQLTRNLPSRASRRLRRNNPSNLSRSQHQRISIDRPRRNNLHPLRPILPETRHKTTNIDTNTPRPPRRRKTTTPSHPPRTNNPHSTQNTNNKTQPSSPPHPPNNTAVSNDPAARRPSQTSPRKHPSDTRPARRHPLNHAINVKPRNRRRQRTNNRLSPTTCTSPRINRHKHRRRRRRRRMRDQARPHNRQPPPPPRLLKTRRTRNSHLQPRPRRQHRRHRIHQTHRV